MSNVSNRHSLNPFIAGKSQPLTDQRLAKIGFKQTDKMKKKGIEALPSVCVSIPQLEIPAVDSKQFSRVLPYVRSMIESAQDGIIRSLYESSKGALTTVSDEELSFDACINFLEAESEGSRLTKEFLQTWFNSEVADNLSVVIAEKLKFSELTPDNEKVIQKHVGLYRELVCSLSGGRSIFENNQLESMKVAINLSSEDDETSKRLLTKIENMQKKDKVEDLIEL